MTRAGAHESETQVWYFRQSKTQIQEPVVVVVVIVVLVVMMVVVVAVGLGFRV